MWLWCNVIRRMCYKKDNRSHLKPVHMRGTIWYETNRNVCILALSNNLLPDTDSQDSNSRVCMCQTYSEFCNYVVIELFTFCTRALKINPNFLFMSCTEVLTTMTRNFKFNQKALQVSQPKSFPLRRVLCIVWNMRLWF